MNIVRAFEHYCLRNDFPPVSAEEQVALDAYTVWLIQRGLLSKTEIAVERGLHSEPALSRGAIELELAPCGGTQFAGSCEHVWCQLERKGRR